MNNREIGRIISITAENILAEIYNFSTNYLNADGYTYFIGEVGSYISIYDIGRTIIGEIVAIHHYPDQQKTEYNTPDYNRQVTINLIGEIRQNKFFFGVTKMPFIFSPIHIVSKTDLSIMLEVSKSEETVKDKNTRLLLLPIGKSVLFPDFPVKVNIDHFFGFHFAVFGNTGAGKSNTIAKLIQTIFSKKNYSAKGARFVIIDSNGEYTQAFSELSHNSDISIKILQTDSQKNKIEIPVWALSVEDWALLLHASERTQLPVLKRALDIAKNFRTSTDKDNRIKNHILASTLIGIFNSSDSSPSKKDKVVSILQSFNTSEINLTVKIPVDGNGTITGLTSGNKAEMAIDINFDFSALADSLGEDVSSINLNNITVEYKMDLDSGLIYFHSAELQTALGVSADAWLSIDLQQILNLSGTDLNIADLMKKVQNGSYKDLVKTQVDAMSFNNVGDYEVAKSALSLFSDDTFTKNGNTYTSKSVVGNSEAGLSENTLILTVNDNDEVIAYSVTSKASVSNLVSMEITASTDADLNSTAKLNYSIPGLVEMNMDMGMKYTETNDVTTGTVDENTEVIDLMGLLLASLTQAQMDISPSVTAE